MEQVVYLDSARLIPIRLVQRINFIHCAKEIIYGRILKCGFTSARDYNCVWSSSSFSSKCIIQLEYLERKKKLGIISIEWEAVQKWLTYKVVYIEKTRINHWFELCFFFPVVYNSKFTDKKLTDRSGPDSVFRETDFFATIKTMILLLIILGAKYMEMC